VALLLGGLPARLVRAITPPYDQPMASTTDLAAQERNTRLRERQQAQRGALTRVHLALQRVGNAEDRHSAQGQVHAVADQLAQAKADLRHLIEAQKAKPAGRRLGTVAEERAAAGREIAAAVDAFGSIAAAAAGLDMPERTIRTYLAENARAESSADAIPR